MYGRHVWTQIKLIGWHFTQALIGSRRLKTSLLSWIYLWDPFKRETVLYRKRANAGQKTTGIIPLFLLTWILAALESKKVAQPFADGRRAVRSNLAPSSIMWLVLVQWGYLWLWDNRDLATATSDPKHYSSVNTIFRLWRREIMCLNNTLWQNR